jgi:hypothetical protein
MVRYFSSRLCQDLSFGAFNFYVIFLVDTVELNDQWKGVIHIAVVWIIGFCFFSAGSSETQIPIYLTTLCITQKPTV